MFECIEMLTIVSRFLENKFEVFFTKDPQPEALKWLLQCRQPKQLGLQGQHQAVDYDFSSVDCEGTS
jgi:hypothetical protein